jgi:hypothetical protein
MRITVAIRYPSYQYRTNTTRRSYNAISMCDYDFGLHNIISPTFTCLYIFYYFFFYVYFSFIVLSIWPTNVGPFADNISTTYHPYIVFKYIIYFIGNNNLIIAIILYFVVASQKTCSATLRYACAIYRVQCSFTCFFFIGNIIRF